MKVVSVKSIVDPVNYTNVVKFLKDNNIPLSETRDDDISAALKILYDNNLLSAEDKKIYEMSLRDLRRYVAESYPAYSVKNKSKVELLRKLEITDFEDLPSEIVDQIGSNLDIKSLINLHNATGIDISDQVYKYYVKKFGLEDENKIGQLNFVINNILRRSDRGEHYLVALIQMFYYADKNNRRVNLSYEEFTSLTANVALNYIKNNKWETDKSNLVPGELWNEKTVKFYKTLKSPFRDILKFKMVEYALNKASEGNMRKIFSFISKDPPSFKDMRGNYAAIMVDWWCEYSYKMEFFLKYFKNIPKEALIAQVNKKMFYETKLFWLYMDEIKPDKKQKREILNNILERETKKIDFLLN